jgi:hypothetical protein
VSPEPYSKPLLPVTAIGALLAALAGCGEWSSRLGSGSIEPDSTPEAYRFSTAALAWPGATRAFQVTPRGDLSNGDWMLRMRPSSGPALAGPPRAVAFEGRWRPPAFWTRTSGPVRWDFQAVALPETGVPSATYRGSSVPAPRDSGLLVSLEVRATNRAPTRVPAVLELALLGIDTASAFVAFDAPPEAAPEYSFGGRESERVVHGWTNLTIAGHSARASWTLEPGAMRSARVVMPAYPTPERALAAWARPAHARRAAQARRYWDREVGRAAHFELGDPEIEAALRAALVTLLECRERRGDHWVPIGGPLHYRDVWLRDGARAIQALSVMGKTHEARALAEGLTAYQWPEGAFSSQRGQLDGTGQALWAFEQALLRPAAPRSLDRYADLAVRGWRWCERQRALGRAMGFPFGAMLTVSDPHDNELVRAQLVGSDAWAIAGYRSGARLLRAAGRTLEADSIEAARTRYVRDFEAALARTNTRDIPPSWQGIGRDWGNVAVAWPCAVLPAGHSRCAALAARLWRDSGGAGLCTYARSDSLHYYLGADLGTWALLAGHRTSADSVLSAMLAWRSASGGAAEIVSSRTRDYGVNPPPHATSAAALVTLVRNSLVFDDDDTLRLTLGARTRWWRGARVVRAPTRWGALDLRFSRTGSEAEWRWTPVPVWTALTLPAGTRPASDPPAPLLRAGREDVVMAPPRTGRARVSLAAGGPSR